MLNQTIEGSRSALPVSAEEAAFRRTFITAVTELTDEELKSFTVTVARRILAEEQVLAEAQAAGTDTIDREWDVEDARERILDLNQEAVARS